MHSENISNHISYICYTRKFEIARFLQNFKEINCKKFDISYLDFDVLLTVHLSITLVIKQLNAKFLVL